MHVTKQEMELAGVHFQGSLRLFEACVSKRVTKFWKKVPLGHIVVIPLTLYSLLLRSCLAIIHYSDLECLFFCLSNWLFSLTQQNCIVKGIWANLDSDLIINPGSVLTICSWTILITIFTI